MKRFLFLLATAAAWAHVGSPDVFFEGKAGAYPVLVTIRPPQVVPGVAEVEVRVLADAVDRVEITPMPISGEAAKHPPVPDQAARHERDPKFYTGELWLMTHGSWQVRIQVFGAAGTGTLAVPVPAIALATTPMGTGLSAVLWFLMALLSVGLVAIVSAAVGQSTLRAGNARIASAISAVVVVGLLVGGAWWWDIEAASFDKRLYRPLNMESSVKDGVLDIRLSDPGWILPKRLDDLAEDHGHLMHLFVLQLPDLRWAAHLHPKQSGPGEFRTNLPQMPAGKYRLYADIVHDNGLAETATADIELPAQNAGLELDKDDSFAAVHSAENGVYKFASGKRLVWTDAAEPVMARNARQFSFRVEGDAKLERYMGMAAHAAFVAEDGSVFAHVHPYGSVAMPAMMLAGTPHVMSGPVEPAFRFPYGVPKPGKYRLLVQTRIDGAVETAIFAFEAK